MDDNKRTLPRDQVILEEVLRTGGVSVEQLVGLLAVSPATVRRELARLEHQGLLRRTHGGAVPTESIHSDLFLHDSSFQEQTRIHTAEKRRIALAAAELVEDGDTIALATGTTTAMVAQSLRHRRDITVVTNTVNVALELSQREGLTVFVTGGYLRGSWFSMVGPTALSAVR
ncbi:MAG: DeoR/GlpR transcriptional regulator, partial [Deltaproteobacteria bacterium]|nr:DeoR/GlpR transcriptional regulator [Deltaproteobacteria bacterium]